MRPLVSVIIPVYKVEECLVRCLESMCGQSMSELEILLIDDASPDKCGDICEVYAARDSRFKVIHHSENRGLSAARNTGIQNALADYLMFVDSDDWVHEDFCKVAYECAIRYQADLVMFRFQRVKDSERFGDNNKLNNDAEDGFIQNGYKTWQEAIDLAHKTVGMAAWDKLYRKELFRNISYPVGYLTEDQGTTYKLIRLASCIYYLDTVLYYHCYRLGSITTLKSEKSLHDWVVMYMQQYHDLAAWGYPADKLEVLLNNIALNYCMKKKPDTKDKNYVFCANALCNSKAIPKNYTWKQRTLILLFKYYKPLFELICILYGTKVY